MPTEEETTIIQKATIYDIRRLLKKSGKESFTVEELCDRLDTIADAKEQVLETLEKLEKDLREDLQG